MSLHGLLLVQGRGEGGGRCKGAFQGGVAKERCRGALQRGIAGGCCRGALQGGGCKGVLQVSIEGGVASMGGVARLTLFTAASGHLSEACG